MQIFRGRGKNPQELQEDIFQNKQRGEHIHHGVDFFSPTASQIQHHVRDHAEGDPFRNAVKQGHGQNAKIRGDRRRIVFACELDLGNRAEHQESHNNQCGRRHKGRNRDKDRCEQHGE